MNCKYTNLQKELIEQCVLPFIPRNKRGFSSQFDMSEIFKDSFESYGAPRIKKALESLGYYVSRPRVARLIKANGLFARRKRKFKTINEFETEMYNQNVAA